MSLRQARGLIGLDGWRLQAARGVSYSNWRNRPMSGSRPSSHDEA
jgi:hypothetical protein